MATARRWKDLRSGNFQFAPDWHRIVDWGHQPEILVEYFNKEGQIHIEIEC